MRERLIIAALGVTTVLCGMLPFSGISMAQVSVFKPSPQNDTEVLIEGWSSAELDRILGAFAKDYSNRIPPPPAFRTEHVRGEVFRIMFPNDIPPDVLSFLVNYLQYPTGYDLSKHAATALGRVTVTEAFQAPLSRYAGQKARVYTPSHDRDFDRVYIAVGGKYFEQTFTDMNCRSVLDGRVPDRVRALW